MNHFPTREALCDAFSDYLDELLGTSAGLTEEPTWSLASLPQIVEGLYRTLALRDRHARAYVMLMIGNRRPMSAWRKRSLMAEKLVARELSEQTPLTPAAGDRGHSYVRLDAGPASVDRAVLLFPNGSYPLSLRDVLT